MNTTTDTIRAHQLAAGDVVTAEGYIDLPIVGVHAHEPQGFISAEYLLGGDIGGFRIYMPSQTLTIRRANPEASH